MKCLDIEKTIGIEIFFSSFKGVHGKLRKNPEDFTVEELSLFPDKNDEGIFLIAEVTAINWETNLLVREIAKRLHISKKRVGFAGTKDRRAKTTRLMSFYKVTIEDITSLNIKDVKIENPYYSNKPVKIGGLLGNRFKVDIKDIEQDVSFDDVHKNINFLVKKGGFPNFFGIQRFGTIRPITHLVGKYIVLDDFEKAVMTYIANPYQSECDQIFNIRKEIEKTRDYSTALKNIPAHLKFEISLLNKLVSNPNDFVGAFKEFPMNLLTMFIYAYQSFLFNKILSERIKRKIPINEAILGDLVLPFRNGVIEDKYIPVSERNIKKVNEQIKKGKAFISGVLFGFDSFFSDGEMGEIEHKIIEAEKIEKRDFIIPEFPKLSSSGLRRSLLAPLKKLDYELLTDYIDQKKFLRLDFELLKGCYATSFLREIIKSNDIRNY